MPPNSRDTWEAYAAMGRIFGRALAGPGSRNTFPKICKHNEDVKFLARLLTFWFPGDAPADQRAFLGGALVGQGGSNTLIFLRFVLVVLRGFRPVVGVHGQAKIFVIFRNKLLAFRNKLSGATPENVPVPGQLGAGQLEGNRECMLYECMNVSIAAVTPIARTLQLMKKELVGIPPGWEGLGWEEGWVQYSLAARGEIPCCCRVRQSWQSW